MSGRGLKKKNRTIKRGRDTLHLAAVHWAQQPKPSPQWHRLMDRLLSPPESGPDPPTNNECPPIGPQDFLAGEECNDCGQYSQR